MAGYIRRNILKALIGAPTIAATPLIASAGNDGAPGQCSERSFLTWAALDSATIVQPGQFVAVEDGGMGGREVIKIVAAGTYDVPPRRRDDDLGFPLVCDLAASGLQAVSQRWAFTSFSEFIEDPRRREAGLLASIPSIGATYRAVAAAGNLGLPNAGGQQWDVLPLPAFDIGYFGANGDGDTDDTDAIQHAIDAAIARNSRQVRIPAGRYRVTNTIIIDQRSSLSILGDGERTTIVQFVNTVPGKALFDATAASSNTHFSDMCFIDAIAGTSTFFKSQDSRPDTDGISHYKDSFERCRIGDFGTGILITTTNPLDGRTHAFCSEPMFFHCRFRNNRVSFRVQNTQAVDITLLGTDIENDDEGESYTFIRDDAGVTFNVFGGSFVGRGIFYDCHQAAGSTALWQAAKLSVTDARFELRRGHNGTVLRPVASRFATHGAIFLDRCLFLAFAQDLELVNFGGKTDVVARSCRVVNGRLMVRQSPTKGITAARAKADGYYESFGSVSVVDSYGMAYEKLASTPYGDFDDIYTGPVVVENSLTDPNGSYVLDDHGFAIAKSATYYGRAVGVGYSKTSRFLYNIDQPRRTFGSIKFILPHGATPVKFFFYKHPYVRKLDVHLNLFAVKDNHDWNNPRSFDVVKDAVPIGSSGSTENRCGYIEAPILLIDSYFDAGDYFQSGFGRWLEGRMYIETEPDGMSGFVGVEYM